MREELDLLQSKLGAAKHQVTGQASASDTKKKSHHVFPCPSLQLGLLYQDFSSERSKWEEEREKARRQTEAAEEKAEAAAAKAKELEHHLEELARGDPGEGRVVMMKMTNVRDNDDDENNGNNGIDKEENVAGDNDNNDVTVDMIMIIMMLLLT